MSFQSYGCLGDEELALFRASVRRFIERHISAVRADGWRTAGMVDRAMWREAGEAGLLLVSTPEQYGGAGGDFRHEVIIMEELGRAGLDDFGIQLHSAIIAAYILEFGTDNQRSQWLPRMATGELIAAIAMTEPGTGSDLQAIRTTARREGDHYVINGQKTFISHGQIANLICVVCRTSDHGAEGISLLLLETEPHRASCGASSSTRSDTTPRIRPNFFSRMFGCRRTAFWAKSKAAVLRSS